MSTTWIDESNTIQTTLLIEYDEDEAYDVDNTYNPIFNDELGNSDKIWTINSR